MLVVDCVAEWVNLALFEWQIRLELKVLQETEREKEGVISVDQQGYSYYQFWVSFGLTK